MEYRNTLLTPYKGYIKSDKSDFSFSSTLQPQITLDSNVIYITFPNKSLEVAASVMTDSDNNVLDDQRAGVVPYATGQGVQWSLEYPEGSTSLTDGNYMHFGYELKDIPEE